jgi:hypothetical protein
MCSHMDLSFEILCLQKILHTYVKFFHFLIVYFVRLEVYQLKENYKYDLSNKT